jgi:hypothetical protein
MPKRDEGALGEFTSYIRKYGVSKAERYNVLFAIPFALVPVIAETDPRATETLSLLCSSVVIPFLAITTRQARYNALGIQRAHTAEYQGEGIQLEFYLDSNLTSKEIFEIWMRFIIDGETREIAFYEDYIADIIIDTLDVSDRVSSSTVIEEAFPINLTVTPLNYASDTIMKITVTFAFKKWSSYFYPSTGAKKPEATPRQTTRGRLLDRIKELGSQEARRRISDSISAIL